VHRGGGVDTVGRGDSSSSWMPGGGKAAYSGNVMFARRRRRAKVQQACCIGLSEQQRETSRRKTTRRNRRNPGIRVTSRETRNPLPGVSVVGSQNGNGCSIRLGCGRDVSIALPPPKVITAVEPARIGLGIKIQIFFLLKQRRS